MSVEDRLRKLGEAEWDLTVERTLRDVTNIADFRRRRRHVAMIGAAALLAIAALVAPRTSRLFATPDIVTRPANERFQQQHDQRHGSTESSREHIEGTVDKADATASTSGETDLDSVTEVASVSQSGHKEGSKTAEGPSVQPPGDHQGILQPKRPLFTRKDRQFWTVPAPAPGGATVVYEWHPSQPNDDERFIRITLKAEKAVGTSGVMAEIWQPSASGTPKKLATVCGKSSLIPIVSTREVQVRIYNGGCDGTTFYSQGEADIEYFK